MGIRDKIGAENVVADHVSRLPGNTRGALDFDITCYTFRDCPVAVISVLTPWSRRIVGYAATGLISPSYLISRAKRSSVKRDLHLGTTHSMEDMQ